MNIKPGFIKAEQTKCGAPVLKSTNSFNFEYKLNNVIKTKQDEIDSFCNSLIQVARQNTIHKSCFKILMVDRNMYPDKLDSVFYRAVCLEMDKRYPGSGYSKKYHGWIIENLPYVDSSTDRDKPKKTVAEMQAEFLAKKNATQCESKEINYTSKDLKIYKSKSYYNERVDYEKAFENDFVYIYDGLSFMSEDGSLLVRFRYRNKLMDKHGRSFQVIYSMEQINFETEKEKKPIKVNELRIPVLIEEYKLVPYNYSVVAQRLKREKAKLDKKYNEEHDKYLSDFENWDERD